MNTGRVAAPGRTRTCPHCKATILESASVCPACHHHLRFDPKAIAERRGVVFLDGADAVVLTPSHQWPTGGVLSADARAAVVRWARERSSPAQRPAAAEPAARAVEIRAASAYRAGALPA